MILCLSDIKEMERRLLQGELDAALASFRHLPSKENETRLVLARSKLQQWEAKCSES